MNISQVIILQEGNSRSFFLHLCGIGPATVAVDYHSCASWGKESHKVSCSINDSTTVHIEVSLGKILKPEVVPCASAGATRALHGLQATSGQLENRKIRFQM